MLQWENTAGNVLSLAMSVIITLSWIMVNRVRQDIREQGNRRGEVDLIELNTVGEPDNALQIHSESYRTLWTECILLIYYSEGSHLP